MLIHKRCEFYTHLSDCVRLFLNTHKIIETKEKYIASGYTNHGDMIVGLGKSPHAAKLMLQRNYKAWINFNQKDVCL